MWPSRAARALEARVVMRCGYDFGPDGPAGRESTWAMRLETLASSLLILSEVECLVPKGEIIWKSKPRFTAVIP